MGGKGYLAYQTTPSSSIFFVSHIIPKSPPHYFDKQRLCVRECVVVVVVAGIGGC